MGVKQPSTAPHLCRKDTIYVATDIKSTATSLVVVKRKVHPGRHVTEFVSASRTRIQKTRVGLANEDAVPTFP